MDGGSQEGFQKYKKAILEAPVLISPDFEKYFLVFSYASEHTVAVVLLQKNDQGEEHPIAFFSKILRDGELKYSIMEKQTYALVKALKYFENIPPPFPHNHLCTQQCSENHTYTAGFRGKES